jgi:hypothetical protein
MPLHAIHNIDDIARLCGVFSVISQNFRRVQIHSHASCPTRNCLALPLLV